MDEMTKDEIQEVDRAMSSDASESDPAAADEIAADAVTDIGEAGIQEASQAKPKRKLPPKIQKIVDYINSHEDVRQMVFFLMFSVLCGLSQMIVTYALSAGLKLASGLAANFDWFVFHFATTAEFIGFLIGSIVGQVLTFVLNRKKTFNRPDYVVMRAVMYAIMAIIIIIMQTYLGGLVTSACYAAKPDAEGFLALVFNLTGQAVAGVAAVIVNFLGNKFFVMRDWGKKKRLQQSETENADSDDDVTAQDEQVDIEA